MASLTRTRTPVTVSPYNESNQYRNSNKFSEDEEREMVLETFVYSLLSQLTRLLDREYVIEPNTFTILAKFLSPFTTCRTHGRGGKKKGRFRVSTCWEWQARNKKIQWNNRYMARTTKTTTRLLAHLTKPSQLYSLHSIERRMSTRDA